MTPEDRRREMDDLAGVVDVPIKRGPGRPRKVDPSLLPPPKSEEEPDSDIDLSYRGVYQIKQGVPVRWLALVFGLTEHQVKRRLKDCRPADVGAHGNPLYLVADASAYLVDPKVDTAEFLRGIRDDDLPDDLRLKLWQARRARNRVMQEEGELWHSTVVLEKFSEYLLSIREKLQLIPDKIERMTGLSPEQYKLVRMIVDGVQEEMYEDAIRMSNSDNTSPLSGQSEEDEVVL
jgi:hypothetical protein